MGRKWRTRAGGTIARPWLRSGLLVLGLGVALLAAPPLLALGWPSLAAPFPTLQMAASALMFAGGLLLVLHLATRTAAAPAKPQEESGLFGHDSTDFASRFDTRTRKGGR